MTSGILYIVATPIGNLDDITQRALDTLAKVDCIVAEDTRHSKRLLDHYQINKPLISCHDQNESFRVNKLIEKLQQGQNLALISDAGTPLISDPGYQVVAHAKAENIQVIPIPGPCAAIAALSAAGLATDRFLFEGFLPAKAGARVQRLEAIKNKPVTTILYESPHRIAALINDMQAVFESERQIVLAKELTKSFETIISGTVSDINAWLLADPKHCRGEFVILINGAVQEQASLAPETLRTLEILLADLPLKQAVKLTASITGEKKNILYDIAVNHSKNN